MISRDAKEILLLYRPGTADSADPEIAQALEAARQDPELGRWLEQHCALQSALRTRLRQIPVPEGLREQIVSEINAEVRSSRRTRLSLLAGAVAAVALVIGLGLFLSPSQSEETLTALRNRVVRWAQADYSAKPMDLATNNLNEIRRYLAAHGSPSDYVVPTALTNAVQAIGCALCSWQGHPVSMLCFAENAKSSLWLFVIDRAALHDPPGTNPSFVQVSKLMTASWSSGDRTYILAGEGEEADLRQYFRNRAGDGYL